MSHQNLRDLEDFAYVGLVASARVNVEMLPWIRFRVCGERCMQGGVCVEGMTGRGECRGNEDRARQCVG